MKYATVEDVITSFPHQVMPSVPGEPDYHSLHAIRKMLQAKARSIDTHIGGGGIWASWCHHIRYCLRRNIATDRLG
jgi:hypothetical protein